MKLKHVGCSNVQGLTFAQELDAVNVICGKNMVGKTAISKAVRLGMTGKLPPPIGTNGIYKLAGNFENEGSMNINLAFDNERTIDLLWKKNSKGSVQLTGNVPADLKMPDLLCEPRMFFAMTSADRIKTIFAASDISQSGFGAKTLIDRLGEIQVMPRKTCEEIVTGIAGRITSLFGNGLSVQGNVQSLVDWLKSQAKQYADEAKTLSGAFAGFKTPTSRPVDKSADIASIEQQIAAKAKDSGAAYNAAWQKVEDAKKKLDEVGIIGMFAEAVEMATTRNEERAAEITVELMKLKSEKPVDVVSLVEREQKLNDEIVRLQDALAEAESTREAKVALMKTVVKLKLCPACKSALNDASDKAVKKLDKEITKTKSAIAELETKLSAVSTELVNGRTVNQKQIVQLTTLAGEQERLVERQNAINAAYSAYRTASKEMSSADKPVADTTLSTTLAELKEQQKAFDQYKADNKRKDELEQQLLLAQCQSEVFKSARDIAIEEQEKVVSTAFNDVLKIARKFTDGLLNSPLEFANGELGRRVSNMDEQNGNLAPIGSWISHETFSGTEELLAYAGFSVALAQSAPVKLIIMDELGRVRPELKLKLVDRMVQLVADGTIDQFIGIDCDVADYFESHEGKRGGSLVDASVNIIEL